MPDYIHLHRIIKILLVSAALLSAGAICLTGLLKTEPEMGRQTLWFAGAATAASGAAILLWAFERRKITLSMVDATGAVFFLWYLFCYHIKGSIAISSLFENGFLALTYPAFRILFAAWRSGGRWILIALWICGLIEAVTGIRQALGMESSSHHLFRVTGTFFNPGPYGGYVATILALALGYAAMKYKYASSVADIRNHRNRWLAHMLWVLCFFLATVTAGAILIILPSTMSRAAFVAVWATLITIFLGNRKVYSVVAAFFRKHRQKCIIGGIVGLLLLCGGAWGIYAVKRDSADGRLLMWKISAKVVLDHPVTGVGPGYFQGAYGDTQADYFRTAQRSDTEIRVAGSPEYGFNEYLQIGMESGVTGLLLFLILVVTALRQLFRARSPFAYGLIALLVFAFFSYPFSVLPLKTVLVIFLASAGAQRTKRRRATVGEMALTGTVLTGGLAAALFLAGPLKRQIEAVKEWQECRRWYSMEFYSYVVEDYPALLPSMRENPTFLFEYGRSLHLEGRHRESVEILQLATRQSADPMQYNVLGNAYKALGEYGRAAEAYLKAQDMVPHRIYPTYLLAKLYAELGDHSSAALYARRVLAIPLKVESPATRDIRQEMEDLLKFRRDGIKN
jgi:O-antigen ligase